MVERTLTRWAVAVLVAAMAAAGCSPTRSARQNIFEVPDAIVSDCSRAVDVEIGGFFEAVPDGSTIRFPPGRCYGQDGTIVLRDRHRLVVDGNGSTFRRITPPNSYEPPTPNIGNANWRIVRGQGVTLQNMTVRGNYNPPARGKAAGQGQHTDQGISLWGAVDTSILHVSVFDTDGEFVEADPDVEAAKARFGGDLSKAAPSRNVLVADLHGEHAARQCVATTAVDGFRLERSYVADCQQNGFDGEIDAEGELNRDIHLIDNTFDGVYFSAVSIPVLSLSGHDGEVGGVEIRGNVLTRAGDTCYPAVLIGADDRGTIDGVVVTGNTLLTAGDGIQLGGAPGGVRGSITSNDIRKTVANAGCDNPGFTPPFATPVRATGSAANVSGNTASGFCCLQDGPT